MHKLLLDASFLSVFSEVEAVESCVGTWKATHVVQAAQVWCNLLLANGCKYAAVTLSYLCDEDCTRAVEESEMTFRSRVSSLD